MSRLALASASLAALALLAAPALAQDQAAARAAVTASMAGSWSGSGEERNPQTGAMEPTEDRFSFAALSEDGLDFAFWNAESLTISEATDDGQVRERTWRLGALVEERVEPMEGIVGPDADGNWSIEEMIEVTGPDGASYDQQIVYALDGGTFTVRASVRPAGSDEELTPVASFSYTKDQ